MNGKINSNHRMVARIWPFDVVATRGALWPIWSIKTTMRQATGQGYRDG